mmetsp:Transcript_32082/g.73304  ORF Transcript_32082/g.73304 Transcript_32082/m.73304 type:complete len:1074 (-) Transcript_32082:40-3261(-)
MSEVQQLVDMGFEEADAKWALKQCNQDVEQAVERLLTGATRAPEPTLPIEDRRQADDFHLAKRDYPTNVPTGYVADDGGADTGVQAFDETNAVERELSLDAALEISMQDGPDDLGEDIMQPTSLRDRLGCGLRNVGNTCYANSFMQTLMHVGEFRDRMLRYRPPSDGGAEAEPSQPQPEPVTAGAATEAEGRKKHCVQLARELRELCAYSILTERRAIDPTRLLNEVVDERGQKLPIGSQEDVGEFMLKFLERLEEGLRVQSQHIPTALVDESVQPKEEPVRIDEPQPEGEGSPAAKQDVPPLDPLLEQARELVDGAPSGQGDSVSGAAGTEAALAGTVEPARKLSQTDAKEPSLLQSLFFGQQVQVFSYRDAEQPAAENAEEKAASKDADVPSGLIVSEEKSEFLQIFLDVKYRDLYSAWDAANCTEVDYTTPSGAVTKASTCIWIERLPKLLFFQMQRVVFDQTKKAQLKLDEPFEFDSTIYVDRFLSSNKEKATEVAAKVRSLRAEQERLSATLNEFRNYEGNGASVGDVLGWASKLVHENASSAASATQRPEVAHPHSFTLQGEAEGSPLQAALKGSSAEVVKLLQSMQESCQRQVDELERELSRRAADVEDAYRDFRCLAYELSAIWVHQGNAGSGHYWAYLKDWRQDRWLRYDDAVVSTVTWPEVREASVGQAGSNTSAYVLVYISKDVADAQASAPEAMAYIEQVQAILPEKLKKAIADDNLLLVQEQRQRQERLAEQQLRQHAEAIFQSYAGLLYKWDQSKRHCDSGGNAHDVVARKKMHDGALLSLECFLYRCYEEREVWTYLLTQSIDVQRKERKWKPAVEGQVFYFLSAILRSRKCYASMLRELPSEKKAELLPIELESMQQKFRLLRTQVYVIDEAISALQKDARALLDSIGSLAYIWAQFDLEADDKFRQNEILLIMSALIFHTVNHVESVRRPDVTATRENYLSMFESSFEYFLLLLHAVEWPSNWKQPLIVRISTLFPTLPGAGHRAGAMPGASKEMVAAHRFTTVNPSWEEYEKLTPPEGNALFERHRGLYAWVMEHEEAVTLRYVQEMIPGYLLET